MVKSKIEWTQMTWNPIVGCSKASEGCRHCYAERMALRLKAMQLLQYQNVVDQDGWTGKLAFASEILQKPKQWTKGRMIFVCSMSDLFHENVERDWIDAVMDVIRETPQHIYQILTKRPFLMRKYFDHHPAPENVWLGVSTENQVMAEQRIPHLLKTKHSGVKFVSIEPMLGPVDLFDFNELDWVIAGGESGPEARPVHPNWLRSVRDQCLKFGIPFFFKQWGGKNKKEAGRQLDGREWNQMPEVMENVSIC